MKIQVDGEDVFDLAPWMEKVIKNDILEAEFEKDMKRRARWVWEHKFERCFERFKAEWEKKLIEAGAESLPTNKEAFANLVFSHPSYKNRSQKDAEQVRQ